MSRTPHRIARLAGAALIAAAAVVGTASPALAHDELIERTVELDPSTGGVEAIVLTFNNSVMDVGTEIVVTDADGADATDGAPEISGPQVSQPIAADLAPGDYSVAWRVVSSDGHPIEGAFALQVATGGAVIADDAEALERDGATFYDAGPDEHDAAEETEQSEGGTPVGALVAVIVGGAAVIAGGLTAATVGRKRRARGMAGEEDRA